MISRNTCCRPIRDCLANSINIIRESLSFTFDLKAKEITWLICSNRLVEPNAIDNKCLASGHSSYPLYSLLHSLVRVCL